MKRSAVYIRRAGPSAASLVSSGSTGAPSGATSRGSQNAPSISTPALVRTRTQNAPPFRSPALRVLLGENRRFRLPNNGAARAGVGPLRPRLIRWPANSRSHFVGLRRRSGTLAMPRRGHKLTPFPEIAIGTLFLLFFRPQCYERHWFPRHPLFPFFMSRTGHLKIVLQA